MTEQRDINMVIRNWTRFGPPVILGPHLPLSSVIDLVLEVFDGLVFIQCFKTELIECLIRRGGQNGKISF